MAHEFRLSLGAMPLDAYQKGWTASVSYTAHLSKYFAWEVFQVTGALHTSTDLRDQLIDAFAVSEEDFAAPRFALTTGLEVSPFYGKQTFVNDRIVHQGLLGGVYGGVIFGSRADLGETLTDIRPAGGFGLGYRLYLSDVLSFRIDVRNLLSLRRAIRDNERPELENVLLMTLSVSVNLWRDDA